MVTRVLRENSAGRCESFHRVCLVFSLLALLQPIAGKGAEPENPDSAPPPGGTTVSSSEVTTLSSPGVATLSLPGAADLDPGWEAFVFPNSIPGVSQSELRMIILARHGGSASSGAKPPDASPAPSDPPPAETTRQGPKHRPRLGRITTNPADKLTEAYYQKVDPVAHDIGSFMFELHQSIENGWDNAMRAESTDWHPAIEVHFMLLVDPDNGVITVESQSSPSTAEALARYRALLESIRPPRFSESLRTKYGTAPLRVQLDFTNVKASPAGS